MRSFALKLRLIYIPFLLIAVGSILVYSLLNIWLTIDNTLIPLKEEVTDLWIPLFLPFVPVVIWLRPRIKLLNLSTRRSNNLPFLYVMVAAFAISVPTLILQRYLRTALGKLTPLASISQIRENKPTKYYSATQYYVDTALASFQNTAVVSGKGNTTLTYTIYIACPIFDRQPVKHVTGDESVKITPAPSSPARPLPDSLQVDKDQPERTQAAAVNVLIPSAWACLHYQESVSNRLSRSEKHEKWDEFVTSTLQDWHQLDPNNFVYLDRIGNSEERDNYQKAIRNNTFVLTTPGPFIILEPKTTSFKDRNGHKLGWTFGALGIGGLIWLIMLAIPKMKETAIEAADENPGKKTSEELKEMGSLLLPRPGYTITPVIMDLNILIFIFMVIAGKGFISFQATDLLAWGANYRPLTSGGHQWWRLVTSTFLHAGIMHLVLNMAGLLFVGIFLEPVLGRKRLAIVYLLSGLGASLTSLWWHPATVSVGASGAIFGLYGVFLALLTTQLFPPVFKRSFTISVGIFVGGNLLFGLAGGIDNAAHIGGLLSGLILGYILYGGLKTEKEEGQEAEPSITDRS